MPDSWTVGAKVLRVTGPTTMMLRLDLGWRIRLDTEVHLTGVHVAPDGERDVAVKRYVMAMLNETGGALDGSGAEVTFVCHVLDGKGSHGQVLVTTAQGEQFDIGMSLLMDELARPSEV